MRFRCLPTAALVCALSLAAIAAACSTYDSDLVGDDASSSGGSSGKSSGKGSGSGSGGEGEGGSGAQGGGGSASNGSGGSGEGGGATTTSSSSGPGGGGAECQTAADCPGSDDECSQRTCEDGACGTKKAPKGTELAEQTDGDCQKAVCDGDGGVTSEPDDGDAPDDGNDCTADACDGGSPTHEPVAEGTECDDGGGKLCNLDGVCVECLVGADCPSLICTDEFTCAPGDCMDVVKNGDETDVDCGGPVCPACPAGKACDANADCVGGLCSNGTCAPTCTDGAKNQDESDVDCGGQSCNPCELGKTCGGPADCTTGACTGSKCVCGPGDHLVISEVRSRGLGGSADEFVELYNPTSQPIVLDDQWKLEARSTSAASYTTRWTGSGATIPAKGHYLITGTGYTQQPAGDAKLSSGITDASSLRIVHMGVTVDAVCYAFNAGTLATLTDPAKGYVCEGTPVSNLPHNDNSSAQSNSDASIERKPGGAAGHCIDTASNVDDFQPIAPASPQSTASPPVP